MWTYIVRRLILMIPTLFGVTIVSFLIMQMAPGDPQLAQLGQGGMAQTGQSREAYLLQKRDLKLDKPLILNFRYFFDYDEADRVAGYFLGRTDQQIADELPAMAESTDPAVKRRFEFLRKMKIYDFDARLADPQRRVDLAEAIRSYLKIYCEDNGVYAVADAMEILTDENSSQRMKIGMIHALDNMVVEPFVYTYSRHPSAKETPLIESTWRIWWDRAKGTFPRLDPDREKWCAGQFNEMVAEPSRAKQFEIMEGFDRDDMRFFVECLLGSSTLKEKAIASAVLRLYISRPLRSTVPLNADAQQVREVTENWVAHYDARISVYHPELVKKFWYIVSDTQYAHMVWRLVTFDFGRSALKTREPVGQKIWDAVIVTAPLVLLAEVVIYLVAVPLGIICAVNRAGSVDRLISLALFFLYSIPPFVAGMMLLLYFSFGDYLKWFPMLGLHSIGAESYGWWHYLTDYLWHATLPVICLSLFSLAGMAMYSRSSMLDVVAQDYIRTARAKGVSSTMVIMKHALRNALIPIITLFAGFLPAMLGGSVLIEVIFGIPGMGRLSWASIEQKDFPTLMALIYVQAIVVMISILLTDLLYVVVDPRISFEGQGKSTA